MLYKKNSKRELSAELFKNPTSEYRGAPFWAWNCKLDRKILLEQLHNFKRMGMGGFHIHSRTGMATPYLSDEFMNLVGMCNEQAKKEGMLCWLYDEDRYSSGFAGGLVTKDVRFRSRHLVFTPWDEQGFETDRAAFDKAVEAGGKPKGYFLARYQVIIRDGVLSSYERLDSASAGNFENVWYAYLELEAESSWRNNQTYVNTLDRRAMERFVQVTHERYYKKLGKDFGGSIPAIFTDEPHFPRIGRLRFPEEKVRLTFAYTDDFDDSFRNAYGISLLDRLPEVVWALPGGHMSPVCYQYHEHVTERFVSAYSDTIGQWCGRHGILFTGHVLEEDSLESQSGVVGEAMRFYRSMQLPGVDMLGDLRNYSTVKQASSAAHQYGREGVLSELYGVTNWDFDFKGHKLQGDWQAALGVTVRVHHLTWVSMEGEAKRDYPASIGAQSPWYREYPLIEDHFARLNTALTRGRPHIRVGVIHPVESCWLQWGVQSQTQDAIRSLDESFQNVVQWMLFGLVDFDFISESLFPSLCPEKAGAPLKVGQMNYETVLVPGCRTLRSTTLDRLEMFRKAGGRVIFLGTPAAFVDAVPSERAVRFSRECICLPFERFSLMEALRNMRDVDIRLDDGSRAHNLFINVRDDGDSRWLFICHVMRGEKAFLSWRGDYVDAEYCDTCHIKIRGEWSADLYDTLDGSVRQVPLKIDKGITSLTIRMYSQDSLLFRLRPAASDAARSPEPLLFRGIPSGEAEIRLSDPVPFTLSEPNVLLLDMAFWSLDGEPWNPCEEILLIDNKVRKRLGMRLRSSSIVQPWVRFGCEEKVCHTLRLCFKIVSEIDVSDVLLTLEHPESVRITLNGIPADSLPSGWYVDHAIQTVKLPGLRTGENRLLLEMPFTDGTNPEWSYLLGNFNVRVAGRYARLTKPARELAFGDITGQGMPFYGGNITYHCKAELPAGHAFIQAAHFCSPLVRVTMDGMISKAIAFAPYTADLGRVIFGEHSFDITAYGCRINTFGPVHNNVKTLRKVGPDAWRMGGNAYSYPYCFKPQGLMQAPVVWVKET